MTRRILPQRRASETFELRHGKQNIAVTVGLFPDRTIGEVFVTGAKVGSSLEAIARDGAVLLSLAIQHGVPLKTIRGALTREPNGAPSSIIGAVVDRIEEVGKTGQE
jgi:hypothetical protein